MLAPIEQKLLTVKCKHIRTRHVVSLTGLRDVDGFKAMILVALSYQALPHHQISGASTPRVITGSDRRTSYCRRSL